MIDRILDQGAAGRDQRHVQPQRLDQWQGAAIAAPGGQHDANAGADASGERVARCSVSWSLAIDQRPVNVDRQQTVTRHSREDQRQLPEGGAAAALQTANGFRSHGARVITLAIVSDQRSHGRRPSSASCSTERVCSFSKYVRPLRTLMWSQGSLASSGSSRCNTADHIDPAIAPVPATTGPRRMCSPQLSSRAPRRQASKIAAADPPVASAEHSFDQRILDRMAFDLHGADPRAGCSK